jgi:hypothetical protein
MTSQRYIASDLTHFVGRRENDDDSRYRLLVDIVKKGRLTAPPGCGKADGVQVLVVNEAGRASANNLIRPAAVCFCDIPLADLAIHMRKYSHFGLAFSKDFLTAKGATPVYYISRTTLDDGRPLGEKFDHHIRDILTTFDELNRQQAALDPVLAGKLADLQRFCEWNIFAFLKFFDHGLADGDENNYYFEREWRTLSNVEFAAADIARIIIPRHYARSLRADLPDYCGELVFSQ